MKEISKWNTTLISCTHQTRAETKKYLQVLGLVQFPSDNLELLISWLLSGPVRVELTEFCSILHFNYYLLYTESSEAPEQK
jgi:hypothetical protein